MAAKTGRKRKKELLAAGAGQPRAGRETAAAASEIQPEFPMPRLAIWISLALIALSLFIYAPVQHHDFVAWDDPEYFAENPMVTAGLTWSGFQWAMTTGHMGNWNPLTWLSYMLSAGLFGLSAGPELLINAVLHAFNSMLLFVLLHAMTRAVWKSAFVAALFAVHPLHVESVAWVSERKDVLSTFLEFLTLWAYLWYTRRPGAVRYLTVAVAFTAALMAKPMVVTLPLLMLLLDYWPLGRLAVQKAGPSGAGRNSLRQKIVEKLPLLGVAFLVGIVTVVAQQKSGAVAGLTKSTMGFRIANALVAYVAYIGKMFWPAGLSALYPLHPLPPFLVAGSAIVLVVTSTAALRWGHAYPWIPVGWLWYFITLLPVIGIVQVGSQAMADRYTYVPLVGLSVILAWGASELTAGLSSRKSLLAAAAAVVILGCTIAAHAQVGYWQDSLALWTHAVEVDPLSDTSQRLLADALAKNGRYQEALPHYEEALRIEPGNAEAHTGLGYAYAGEGKPEDAIRQYREALRLKPDQVDAHNDLALALAGEGKFEEAIRHYNEVLRLKPHASGTHSNLGVSLFRVGRSSEAEAQLNEALRLQPGNADAHNNLGILFANQGRLNDAVLHFQRAVELRPDFEDARRNLSIALAQRDKSPDKPQ
jgi:Flp pilus assembly protein TadD